MFVPSILLFAMGLLGATDIVLFHVRAHGLRDRPESRAELVTHFLRGPTYCALFLAVPNFDLAGGWYAALLALLAFDVGISIVDFWLEPASRREAGGLPRGEYVLHVVLAMLFGALVATVLSGGAERFGRSTSIQWIPMGTGEVPTLLRVALMAMAPAVLFTGLLDLRAVLRLGRVPAHSP
ncbi:MAG: hypothetical protein AAF726_02915 [Planctomycetota bacterium]